MSVVSMENETIGSNQYAPVTKTRAGIKSICGIIILTCAVMTTLVIGIVLATSTTKTTTTTTIATTITPPITTTKTTATTTRKTKTTPTTTTTTYMITTTNQVGPVKCEDKYGYLSWEAASCNECGDMYAEIYETYNIDGYLCNGDDCYWNYDLGECQAIGNYILTMLHQPDF